MIEHDELENITVQNKHNLSKHEAICKERYDHICMRLTRLERILIAMSGGIIFVLVQIALKLPS